MKDKLLRMNQDYTNRVRTLLDEMTKYDDEILNRPAASGGWSVLQNMHHLILSEEKSMDYVRKKLSFEGTHPKVGLKEDWRYFLLMAFLSLPIKFKAPPRIGGNPEDLPAVSSLAEVREKWLTTRQKWEDFFQNMDADLATRTVFKHVRAGKLGWKHMLKFYIFHFERHRQQIYRTCL